MERWAPVVLRAGLVVVALWFGYQQVAAPEAWVVWVPGWAVVPGGLGAQSIVLINGWLEIALGVLLLAGLYTRPAALVLGLHLLVIALEIGVTPVGVRDFGLSLAALSLALMPSGAYTLDAYFSRTA